MVLRNSLDYPKHERPLKLELEALFQNWYQKAKGINFIKHYTAEDIVFDGFYPFYTTQKARILFIGREALGISGLNYLDILYSAYRKNCVGNRHINQHKFHYLMFYIAYGLNHDFARWEDIPPASELTGTFGKKNGLSFAFMNLSKFSNESESWHSDWELIDNFTSSFQDMDISYFNKEIEILDPDLIVTMNLEERLRVLGETSVVQYGDNASCYYLKTNRNRILLIDLFHFSAPNKSGREIYYEPVIELCTKYEIFV